MGDVLSGVSGEFGALGFLCAIRLGGVGLSVAPLRLSTVLSGHQFVLFQPEGDGRLHQHAHHGVAALEDEPV